MKLIGLFLTCLFLASCGKFSDGTSVWQEGLWVLPWLTGLAAIFFYVKAILSSKSNSTQTTWNMFRDFTGNVPVWKIGFFYFGVGLTIATIAIIIMVNSDK